MDKITPARVSVVLVAILGAVGMFFPQAIPYTDSFKAEYCGPETPVEEPAE